MKQFMWCLLFMGIIVGNPLEQDLIQLRNDLQLLLNQLQQTKPHEEGIRFEAGRIVFPAGTSAQESAEIAQQYLSNFRADAKKYISVRPEGADELGHIRNTFDQLPSLLNQSNVEDLIKLYVTLYGLSDAKLTQWDDAFLKYYLRLLYLTATPVGWFDQRLLSTEQLHLFNSIYNILEKIGTLTDIERGYYEVFQTPPPLPSRQREEAVRPTLPREEVISSSAPGETADRPDIDSSIAERLAARRKNIAPKERPEEKVTEELPEWERGLFEIEEPEESAEKGKAQQERQPSRTADILEILRQKVAK